MVAPVLQSPLRGSRCPVLLGSRNFSGCIGLRDVSHSVTNSSSLLTPVCHTIAVAFLSPLGASSSKSFLNHPTFRIPSGSYCGLGLYRGLCKLNLFDALFLYFSSIL